MVESSRSILWCALIAAVISMALSFHWQFPPRVDAGAYDNIAWNFARGFGYVEDAGNAAHPELDDGIVRVGPGYQFFLAGIYALFGHRIWIVWVLQAILHAISTVLVFRIAGLLFPVYKSLPLLAAILFGFSPDILFMTTMLLTETLFLCVLLGSLYVTLVFFKNPGWAGLIGMGLLWGGAILTRPVALLPFLLIMGVLCARKEFSRAVIFAALVVLLVAPWSFFMSHRYGAFILTTTAGGYDLWVGNNPGATGGFDKTPEIQVFRNTHHSVEADRVGKEKYFAFLMEHPIQFIELQIRKTALYFSLLRPTGNWLDLQFFPVDRALLAILSTVWTAVLFGLGIAGLVPFGLSARSDFYARFFVIFAVLQPIAVIPIIVATRYRYALFPFLAIATAYMVGHIRELGAKDTTIRSAIMGAGIFLFAATLYDVVLHAGEIWTKIITIL